MGRKLRYPDKIIAPLPPGSLDRIKAVLTEGEDKTDFLREVIAEGLERREARLGIKAGAALTPKTKPSAKPPSPSKD